jgi:F-type H+-transporting ATPase subunit a
MGLEFLVRVRHTALISGAVVALMAARYVSPMGGLGVALGVVWSLLNLFLLESLVVTITGEERRTFPGLQRAGWILLGFLALFAAGGWLLTQLPIRPLLYGFLLPLGVIVLKSASTLLVQSRLWKSLTATPWRGAAVVAILLLLAWWVVPSWLQGVSSASPARTEPIAQNAPPAAAESHEAAGEAHAAEAEESGPQKFPNVITVLSRANPHAEWAHFLHHNEAVIFSLLVAFLLCLICFFATRNPQMIPGPLQNALEAMVEGLYDFISGIIGEKHAPRFVPFLGTLGLYIWFMNLFGLIPFMDSPTSSLNVTFALGLIVFLYAQWIGLRGLGPLGYVDHLLGSPRDLTGWLLAPLMLPIHILGELAKPISLSCRLFGNIFGEDMLLVAFVSLGITSLSFAHLPFGLPLQLPFLLLALLTSTLQAAVFMVLSTIYFLLMLPHDDHAHEPEGQHAHSH